ncbi:MAG: hypothetical protein KIT25_12205 [Enhydrobacter sp.]|nr:MAG: hypothetical protein KIT25_12205 [Enhydrobacter sp.]
MLLVFAAPVSAQTSLSQQCADFGLSSYRQSDSAILRIVVNDHPAPVLERLSMSVGTQTVAAALTLKGQMTYRRRPAVEAQFVCLLDAAERPVFFYAVPTLAGRVAPTPLVRGSGGAVVSTPIGQPAVGPPRAPATGAEPAGTTMLMRGLIRDIGGRLQITPCDGAPLPLDDRTAGLELTQTLRELTAGRDGRPLFAEILGGRDGGPGGGIAAIELRRAAIETIGCRERFDQREWIAMGSEPAWRLEITGRDMVVIQPGTGAGPRIAHGGWRREAGRVVYAGNQSGGMRVTIEERRCIDAASGSLFSYYVEVQSEGKSFGGCAAHNPAMPAP